MFLIVYGFRQDSLLYFYFLELIISEESSLWLKFCEQGTVMALFMYIDECGLQCFFL